MCYAGYRITVLSVVQAYFRRRMNTFDGAVIVRLFVDVMLFTFASFTSLSRVIDNKHHWSDVLAGAVLGFIGAMWTVSKSG